MISHEYFPRETFEVMNPYSGVLVSRVADCGEEEVEAAIHEVGQYRVIMLIFILLSKAATAFKTWRKTTSKERAAVLRRIGDLLLAKKEELGAILTREQGKPRGEAEGEVGATAPWLVLRLSPRLASLPHFSIFSPRSADHRRARCTPRRHPASSSSR